MKQVKRYKLCRMIIVFLFLLSFFPINNLYSQNIIEFNKFKNIFEEKTHKHHWEDQLKGNKNELQFIFSLLFIVYKEVFSSQDIDSCVYTPSCSVYAIETIKQNGIPIGIMDAFDRISRCNPERHKNYPIDPKTKKYYDPVK